MIAKSYHVFPRLSTELWHISRATAFTFSASSLYHPGPDGALGPGLWSCRGGNRKCASSGPPQQEFFQGPMVHRLMIQGKRCRKRQVNRQSIHFPSTRGPLPQASGDRGHRRHSRACSECYSLPPKNQYLIPSGILLLIYSPPLRAYAYC